VKTRKIISTLFIAAGILATGTISYAGIQAVEAPMPLMICKDSYRQQSMMANILTTTTYVIEAEDQCPMANINKIPKALKVLDVIKKMPVLSVQITQPKPPSRNKEVPISTMPQSLTVHFGFDSSIPGDIETESIKSFAKRLPKDAVVGVDGYTCWMGSREHNLRLSQERADYVAAYLKKLGVLIGHVEGKGECCFVNSVAPALNRRVDIIQQKGGDVKPTGEHLTPDTNSDEIQKKSEEVLP